MSTAQAKLTAAQVILIAADDITNAGNPEFSEWDLTVAAWSRDKHRFGYRGYEDLYPDHKRVTVEIMGQTKRDNPIRRGFMKKVRANYYMITALGQAEASRLRQGAENGASTAKSAGRIYAALEPYISHRSFEAWRRDPNEPRSWLGAAAFLGLAKGSANDLNDRLRFVRTAIMQGLHWCDETGRRIE